MSQEPPRLEGTPESEPQHKRLRKSATERVFFGVAGGIAEYLDVDPILVRVVFVALMFAGLAALLIYVILAIIMPGPNDDADRSTTFRGSPQQALGIVIIIVGALLLLGNLHFFRWIPWNVTWPAALIVIGLVIFMSQSRSTR